MTLTYNLIISTTKSSSTLKYNNKSIVLNSMDDVIAELKYLNDYIIDDTLTEYDLPRGYSCKIEGKFTGITLKLIQN